MTEIIETLDVAVEEAANMGIPVRNPTQRFITFSIVGGLLVWYFKPDFAFYDKVEFGGGHGPVQKNVVGSVKKRVPRPWTVTNTKNLPHATIFPWYLAAIVPGIAMSYFI